MSDEPNGLEPIHSLVDELKQKARHHPELHDAVDGLDESLRRVGAIMKHHSLRLQVPSDYRPPGGSSSKPRKTGQG